MPQRNMQCKKIALCNTKWCNTQKIKWIPHCECMYAPRMPYFKWLVKVGFGEPDYVRIGNKSNFCFFQVRLASPVVRGSWCLLSLVLPQVPDKYWIISWTHCWISLNFYENKFNLDLIGINPLWYLTLQLYRMVVFPLVAELLPYTSVQSLTWISESEYVIPFVFWIFQCMNLNI